MSVLKLTELAPNMVLASDLINHEGRFLLPAGTVLTDRSISMLKAWGVLEAKIREEGSGGIDTARSRIDPAAMATARMINEKRFLHVSMAHPVMRELEALSSMRKARAVEGGALGNSPSFPEEAGRVNVYEETLPPINISALSQFGHRLPTLPAVFNRINETIMNQNSSAGDIAAVISKDTGITTQLLGIVNSSFYGFVSKIDTVSRAVAIVGTRQLTSLVFGINIIKIFDNIPARHIDMKGFWKHSIACGITSRIIAGYKNIQNTERLFVAGLLHDIGRLLMYRLWPEHSRRALLRSRREMKLLYQVEAELLGMDHAVIGGNMAEQWKLPFLLETTIRNHHTPKASHNKLESSIIHLADIVVNAMEMGSSGDIFVPPLDEDAWRVLDLSESLLPLIIDHVDRQLDDVMTYFFPHGRYEN